MGSGRREVLGAPWLHLAPCIPTGSNMGPRALGEPSLSLKAGGMMRVILRVNLTRLMSLQNPDLTQVRRGVCRQDMLGLTPGLGSPHLDAPGPPSPSLCPLGPSLPSPSPQFFSLPEVAREPASGSQMARPGFFLRTFTSYP